MGNSFLKIYFDKGYTNCMSGTADCTRPLGLKNTDNKTLPSITTHAATTSTSKVDSVESMS